MQHRAIVSAFHVLVLGDLLVSTGSVSLRNVRHDAVDGGQFFSYDYSKHGQDWVAGQCSSRARQSPVDLPAALPVTNVFDYKYEPIITAFDLMNTGKTFSADMAGLGYGGVTYDNAWYQLLNINIHSLSEHAWAGMQMPLELHLVHQRYDGNGLLVVAIPIESPTLTAAAMAAAGMAGMPHAAFLQSNTSAASDLFATLAKQVPYPAGRSYAEPPATEPMFNPLLQAFLKVQPPAVNMKVSVPANGMQAYDLNTLMQGGHFYEYAGSLTAPPCAEIATWLVRKDSIKASDKQLMYLHDAIYKTTADFGNYRSLMPLNGRTIAMRMARFEEAFVTIAPPVQVEKWVNPREVNAMKWAVDAMKMAKASTDYVKNLDMRLRNAAQAHAAALAPQPEPLSVHGQLAIAGGAVQPGAAVPILPVAVYQPPLQMENMAETMARNLATTATKEINDASVEISKQSKDAATNAARAAAGLVGPAHGSQGALANAQAVGAANATEVARLMAQGGAAGGVAAPVNIGNHVR